MNPPEINNTAQITVADLLAYDRAAAETPIVWESDSWLRNREGINPSEKLELRIIEPSVTPWGRVDFEHFYPSYAKSFEPTKFVINGLRLIRSQWEGVVVQPIKTPMIKVVGADGQGKEVPNYWRTSFQALDEVKGEDDRTGYRDSNTLTHCLKIIASEDGKTFEAVVRRAEAICVAANGLDGVPCDAPNAQPNPGANHLQRWQSGDGIEWTFAGYSEN